MDAKQIDKIPFMVETPSEEASGEEQSFQRLRSALPLFTQGAR
jgi:hypothetical protein